MAQTILFLRGVQGVPSGSRSLCELAAHCCMVAQAGRYQGRALFPILGTLFQWGWGSAVILPPSLPLTQVSQCKSGSLWLQKNLNLDSVREFRLPLN